MALQTMQDVLTSGAALTYAAAAGGGDTFPYDPNGFIHIKNGGGGAITATVVVPGTLYGQALADIARVINAGADALIKMAQGMVDPATGLISVTYSGVTSVTVAALRAPAA
jgi:hypothetical protein